MKTNVIASENTSLTQLEEAFATFNQVSAELDLNYRELESRVGNLSEELAAANSARIKELSEKEQLAAKLSALMDALPGGIISINEKGIIKEENPVAIQLMGMSCQGLSWHQALNKAASIDLTLSGEVSFSNGKRISISSSAYGDDGDTIILLTDVTENYQLSAVINREQRLTALGEMAARLAHQIRTPLSSAILYLSHLPSVVTPALSDSPVEQRDDSNIVTDKILNRLRQIEKLIQGMLSYIRGGVDSRQEFSLKQLLTEIKDSSSLQIKIAEGELKLKLPRQECIIKANQEAIFNAISNLIENSIQAIDSKPSILITLTMQNDSYQISIEDNGPGISDAIKEKVFDPFFSTRAMGSGLGLAVVLSIVKAHQGEIFIESSKQGGSIFRITFPDGMNTAIEEPGIWGSDAQHFFNHGLKDSRHGVKI